MRVLLSPSTGYHRRSPATKTLGSSRNSASRPPWMVTIQRNCSVFSAIGSPSLSGYSISAEAGGVCVLMDRVLPGILGRRAGLGRHFGRIQAVGLDVGVHGVGDLIADAPPF